MRLNYYQVLLSTSLLTVLFLVPFCKVNAQQQFSLDQIIRLARDNSLSAQQAENKKENRYGSYLKYKSNFYPQLSLEGALPDFSRAIDPVTQPDGTQKFIPRSFANSYLGLKLKQTISATGGEIYLESQITRIDNLAEEEGGSTTSYSGNPLVLGFYQPIFTHNWLKWSKKIEPIRYQEAEKKYDEELEWIAWKATDLYFNLMIEQINYRIAQKNLKSSTNILEKSEENTNVSESEKLQMELSIMKAQSDVASAELRADNAMLRLKTFIGLSESDKSFDLEIPKEIPEFKIDDKIAVKYAKKNRQRYLSFKRRKLEAERDVARAKAESNLDLYLTGSFGLTQQADNLPGVYENPQNQQRVRLGFVIPVADFGRRKANLQTAIANQKLVESSVAQDEINFEQEIVVLTKQFPILVNKVKTTNKANEIAEKRFNLSHKQYMRQKISATDYNLALQEKDKSTREYLKALKDYWLAYYDLRMKTLYDFEGNMSMIGM
ncbi:TolC family protein [Limibacter armeniacum]|uniref:TolC family protein n=1 Tax=Limibacter armeniacum TaxID=466084 RepID=UPI002FE632AE